MSGREISPSQRERQLLAQLKKTSDFHEKNAITGQLKVVRRLKKMSEVNELEQIVNQDDEKEDKTVRLEESESEPEYRKFGFSSQAEMKQAQRDTIAVLNSKAREPYAAKNQKGKMTLKGQQRGRADEYARNQRQSQQISKKPSLARDSKLKGKAEESDQDQRRSRPVSKPSLKQVPQKKSKAEEAIQKEEPTKLQLFLQSCRNKGSKQLPQQYKRQIKPQLTIDEVWRHKKVGKNKQLSIDDSDIDSEEPIIKKASKPTGKEAYKRYNGGSEDEDKLIEKAMKLSLQPNKYENLDNYAFQQSKSLSKEEEVAAKPGKKKQTKAQKKPVKARTKSSLKDSRSERTGPLMRENFVITGEFSDFNKDDFIEIIQHLGGSYSKTMVKKCTVLIQGAFCVDRFMKQTSQPVSETTKSRDARSMKIRIVPYSEIDQFLIEKTGFDLAHYLAEQRERRRAIKMESSSVPQVPIKAPEIECVDINLTMPWVNKYRPRNLEDVVGENNQIATLRDWLQSWEDIHVRGNRREVKEIKGWNAAGSINSRAALISGDPGIGKTTTARLLAMEYNFGFVEFNASDVRNRSGVNLMQSGSLGLTSERQLTKSLLIMDEVDGMSAGDRGGVAAIINMIKNTKIPIICICNDRASEKIRTLAGYCLDVRFYKPPKYLVAKRLGKILELEGGSGEMRALENLVESFQNDMRQIISYLQLIFRTVTRNITFESLRSRNQHTKDAAVMVNSFEATRKLLNRSDFSRMRIGERTECFFIDSDIVPLMVHENLLASAKKTQFSNQQFHEFVKGIHGMVVGDMMDKVIRKQQEWGLMPSYGFMTCVYSTEKVSEAMGFPVFPSWLGKNSSERKNKRLARQFKDYIYPTTLCSNWKEVKALYAPLITNEMVELLTWEVGDVEQACLFMEQYHFGPQVLYEHLVSLQYNSAKKINPLASVSPATKSQLTRLFNRRHEEAKLTKVKVIKMKDEHIKFNSVLEQVEDVLVEEEQQQPASNIHQPKVSTKRSKLKK